MYSSPPKRTDLIFVEFRRIFVKNLRKKPTYKTSHQKIEYWISSIKSTNNKTPVIKMFRTPPENIWAPVRKRIVKVSKLVVVTLIIILKRMLGLKSRKPLVSLIISLVALCRYTVVPSLSLKIERWLYAMF